MYIIPFEHVILLEELLKTYFHRRTNTKLSMDKDIHCQTVYNCHEHFKTYIGTPKQANVSTLVRTRNIFEAGIVSESLEQIIVVHKKIKKNHMLTIFW